MFEHKPWVPEGYKTGLNGQRIAIVGYSHHTDSDSDDLTIKTMQGVLRGELDTKTQFFYKIRDYFGYKSHRDFWSQVLFFNFVPYAIGTADHRYDNATREQVLQARERVLRIIADHSPQKLVVFSRKGWRSFPATVEESTSGGMCSKLGKEELAEFEKGTYRNLSEITAAYGLRHPQYARDDIMTLAIQIITADSIPE